VFIYENGEKIFEDVKNGVVGVCYSSRMILLLKIITNVGIMLKDSKPML
jgi:hypothetical protein